MKKPLLLAVGILGLVGCIADDVDEFHGYPAAAEAPLSLDEVEAWILAGELAAQLAAQGYPQPGPFAVPNAPGFQPGVVPYFPIPEGAFGPQGGFGPLGGFQGGGGFDAGQGGDFYANDLIDTTISTSGDSGYISLGDGTFVSW